MLKELQPKEAAEAIKKDGAVLLDVRTPEEFALGHCEGAINVPVKLAGPDGAPSLDNPDFEKQAKEALGNGESNVVCTCFAGRRGGLAAEKLAAAGFDSVANLVGGMGAWVKEELPVKGEVKPPAGH